MATLEHPGPSEPSAPPAPRGSASAPPSSAAPSRAGTAGASGAFRGFLAWAKGRPGARWYLRPWIWIAALVVAGMTAGGGAGTIGLGGEDAVRYLGASVETLPTNCHGKSASGGVECGSWSGSVSFSLRVTTISLYDEGWDGHVRYGGSLPEGLGWGMTVDDVVAKLGSPDSSSTAFQAGVLTYDQTGAGYSRLELYFSPNGKLGRVSVSE